MNSHNPVRLNTSIALKLHAFGLNRLHDPNWTGLDLFYYVKDHGKGQEEPNDLLIKTHRSGLLYKIGLLLYRQYFLQEEYPKSLTAEYRYWYLVDLYELILTTTREPQERTMDAASKLLDKIDSIDWASDETNYWKAVRRPNVYATILKLIDTHLDNISSLASEYASDYAERVFHDRQLCEYIGKLLVTIGFDGTESSADSPKKWIARPNFWPTWVLGAIIARDRGLCAHCSISITSELLAPKNIDHIVPLAKAGTNDLSNLQLLCKKCNSQKRATELAVKSSVPWYIRHHSH